MQKFSTSAIAAGLAGIMAVTAPMPAYAQSVSIQFGAQQDRYISTYCDRHPRDPDCWDWRDNRQHWGRSHYQNFYRSHQTDMGGAMIAGIFGLAAGAIISGAANSGRISSNHVDACYDRYRSYDARSDTFLGYDGLRHRCRL